uniref:Ribosomal protein S6 kinase-like 1 n=1 Tax=Salarias fasciatus TaxID=181472 RepID=A0A672G5J6_SALFA
SPDGAHLEPRRVRTEAAMAKRDYLVEAAKQIRMALDSEVNEDYEAAFSYYKNVDPNKDRREAVKRKTTQYLKRAEEIFITHLQDNLGKGSSYLGGYSSLRFRPIRHLSSPVEDLEMCKVVGVADKSLVKSSWESRDQPTIIPQGVPYMVKLLRYYVSEDAVYLHLEHVKGEAPWTDTPSTTSPNEHSKIQAQVNARIHPPAPSLCLHSGDTQEKPALPLSCARVSQALDAISELHRQRAGMEGSFLSWFSSGPPGAPPPPPRRTEPEGPDDQIIEVDGWCHLPRFPAKTPTRPADRSVQTCWGLPEAEVRVWGAQVLLALESLHQQGVLCRDLNPRNVLLTSNGESAQSPQLCPEGPTFR